MNFQIVVYRNIKYLNQPGEDAWVASCRPFPWTEDAPLRVCGPTPRDAQQRLKQVIQQRLDASYPDLVTNDIWLTPSEHAMSDDSVRSGDLNSLKVRVVAYKGLIIIEPIEPENNVGKEFGWVPMGQTRIGSVICDTNKYLGVSREAFELMKQIKQGSDCIGDISWFLCSDGTWAFSWFGPIYRVINPDTAIGDRDFKVTDILLSTCTIIPNEVPAEATELIDAQGSTTIWKNQDGIEIPANLV